MNARSARLLALRRLDWDYQDRERGYVKHPPAGSSRLPRHRTTTKPRRRRATLRRMAAPRDPQSTGALREALGSAALVGVAALLLYSICERT